jgi:hypothetical protein
MLEREIKAAKDSLDNLTRRVAYTPMPPVKRWLIVSEDELVRTRCRSRI